MSARRARRIAAAALLATIVPLAACGRSDPPASPEAGTTTPSPADGTRWLAVVDAAPLADDLDHATARLRDVFGEALVVSPSDCFEGLPAEGGEGYVIGAVGDTRTDVERLLEEAGERAMFVAAVTILCSD